MPARPSAVRADAPQVTAYGIGGSGAQSHPVVDGALPRSPAELTALDAIGPQVAGSAAIGLAFSAATNGRAETGPCSPRHPSGLNRPV